MKITNRSNGAPVPVSALECRASPADSPTVLRPPEPRGDLTPITLGSQKTRVFIVDDHVLIRHGLATLITDEADMEVCGQAEDSASALQGILKAEPDIVIVDISLKGNSGLELIKSVKAQNPKIQILVLSMHHESIYALRALKAGARGYVMKQDVIDKVIDGIRRLRKGHLCVSDDIAGHMLNRLIGGDASDETSVVAGLSDRELEIVTLIGNGHSTREIATRLHLSVKTIETHRAHIKEKLNLQNATQLVQTCVRWVEENAAGRGAAPNRAAEVEHGSS
jgi:DNA-binding NarL/FixJ family response regulator